MENTSDQLLLSRDPSSAAELAHLIKKLADAANSVKLLRDER